MQRNACKHTKNRRTWAHIHTHTHTHTHTLTETDSVCHCCLFICQSGHPESHVLKSDCVCVCVCLCVCVLSPPSVRYHWSGMLHRALYCLTYGFCSSALSRKQGQAGRLRMEPLGLMQFPSSPVVFNVSWVKLGYWCGFANGVTGLSAGWLCCLLVSCGTSGSAAEVGRAGCSCESMWQTHLLWIAHLHAVNCSLRFPFVSL